MTIQLDEDGLVRELAPRLDDAAFRTGLSNLANDPFFLAFFLVSVSQGEGLGEAAVAMIGQDELAARLHDLARQEREECGHKEQTLDAARALFPEYFDDGRYRWDGALMGRDYYVTVLEANRARLKERGRYSRLNLYLTTTFGYEIMVLLLYRAVADAVAKSRLPAAVRERVHAVLEGILAEEETHLGIVEQHTALLASPREELSADALRMLEALEGLEREDYVFAAELSVDEIVRSMGVYADTDRYRADIEAGATAA